MAIILTNDLLGKDRREYKAIKAEMMAISQEQKREKQNVNEEEMNRIKLSFPRNLQFAMELASERGSHTDAQLEDYVTLL